MKGCGLHGEGEEQERMGWKNSRKEGLDGDDGCAWGGT